MRCPGCGAGLYSSCPDTNTSWFTVYNFECGVAFMAFKDIVLCISLCPTVGAFEDRYNEPHYDLWSMEHASRLKQGFTHQLLYQQKENRP